jgi:hypothetical protein
MNLDAFTRPGSSFDIQLDALAERIVVRVHLGWNAGAGGTRLNRLRTIAAALKHITEAK